MGIWNGKITVCVLYKDVIIGAWMHLCTRDVNYFGDVSSVRYLSVLYNLFL